MAPIKRRFRKVGRMLKRPRDLKVKVETPEDTSTSDPKLLVKSESKDLANENPKDSGLEDQTFQPESDLSENGKKSVQNENCLALTDIASTSAEADVGPKSDSESDESVVEDFMVEKILTKRKKAGGDDYEYFLKWHGFGDAYNTWEPAENMDCPELLAEFEARWVENRKGGGGRRGSRKFKKNRPARVSGFERGLEAEHVIAGVEFADAQKAFLVKWKGTNEADVVCYEDFKQKFPYLVIRFFEERLGWYQPEDESENVNDAQAN